MRNIGKKFRPVIKSGVRNTEKSISHNSKRIVNVPSIGKRDERILKHTEMKSTQRLVNVAVKPD